MTVGISAGGTPILRVAALAALAALVVAAVTVTRRAGDPPRGITWTALAAWLYSGAVAGMAMAWLPFVVSFAVPLSYYHHLVWLATWR